MELALLLPVLFLLGLASVDFVRILSAEVKIQNAAREGARYGARFSYDVQGIRQRVLDELGSATQNCGPQALTAITAVRSDAPTPPGGAQITVTITCKFTFLTPMPTTGGSCALTAMAGMLVI